MISPPMGITRKSDFGCADVVVSCFGCVGALVGASVAGAVVGAIVVGAGILVMGSATSSVPGSFEREFILLIVPKVATPTARTQMAKAT